MIPKNHSLYLTDITDFVMVKKPDWKNKVSTFVTRARHEKIVSSTE